MSDARAPVALVTGASRGAGRGIAIALGSHGCTVYVTGRSQQLGDHALAGTIHETAAAITAAGGRGVAVACDHSDDAQVAALFERIRADGGGLDILVNNAAAIYDELNTPGVFWEKPLKLADLIDVGVRSSYVASWHAVPLMLEQGREDSPGLIVFTSASGAVHYTFGPAYGAHKAGMDKMAWDMAVDFRHAEVPVAAASIWMGAVMTERLRMVIDSDPATFGVLEDRAETAEFTGHVVWELFNDALLSGRSGGTFIGAELAREYGVMDAGGRQPTSYRDTDGVAPFTYYDRVIR